ncbi:paraquat-inducible protein A [Formicincola oecophyllae]|uniref:paraquat-inducible protein A n=1 Tax=Formicincola oecophyllae TaxID=2558361 RepID=UPI001F0E0CB8|nr:paraquat-inducible protein A [Formicincola oecophyllae]
MDNPHHSSELRIVTGIMECRTCGLFQRLPAVLPGEVAECCRCGSQLERRRRTATLGGPWAFCIAALAFYGALLVSSVMMLNVYGHVNVIVMMSGPHQLVSQGMGIIAVLVALTSVILPGVVLLMMCAILYGAGKDDLPTWCRPLLAWYERLRPWSMVEVYVIGLLVAYTKLIDLALVILLPGTFLLGALMLSMAALDSTFDAEMIWEHRSVRAEKGHPPYDGATNPMPPPRHMLSCGTCELVLLAPHAIPNTADMGDCPRCGQILHRRKPNAVQGAICFLIAAFVFYIPANCLPVMTYARLGKGYPNTIIGGVHELWQADLWVLALIVLFASITLPVLKIVSLALMLYCELTRRAWHLIGLSKLYHIVMLIGRWSMIDVFMISILVAVVRFSFFAHVTADPGIVFFAMVVVLTIFAADMYDPRGVWDAAGRNERHPGFLPHQHRHPLKRRHRGHGCPKGPPVVTTTPEPLASLGAEGQP